jgi:hypothetical protein
MVALCVEVILQHVSAKHKQWQQRNMWEYVVVSLAMPGFAWAEACTVICLLAG